MQELFDRYKNEGCQCRICNRFNYEENLLARVFPHLPEDLQIELEKYLDWYYQALEVAEMNLNDCAVQYDNSPLVLSERDSQQFWETVIDPPDPSETLSNLLRNNSPKIGETYD